MTIERKRVSLLVWACACERCGYKWNSTAEKPPTRCPGCKARGFNRPARWARPDRRAKAPKRKQK